jgi:two-component system, response regulator
MNDRSDRVTLFYAEDDPDDQVLLRDAVRECGLPVDLRFVPGGEALLEALRAPPEAPATASGGGRLVLLDLNMPGMGGLAVLRAIREDPALRSLPVVVLTTSGSPEDVNRCYEAGANSYLVKPSTYGEMVRMMQMAGSYWVGLCRLAGGPSR